MSWRKREQRQRHGSCRLRRKENRDLPLVCSGEEENKGDDMALAGTDTYHLYEVEKKRTKATT
jgi:hypothetical protein